MDVMLKGQQTSSYFTPASAFVDVLDYLAKTPDLPRQMPWIGALKIEAVDSLRAKDLNTPALVVSKVIPGQAGDRAGLKNDDLIVGLNGQPLPKQPHPALLQVYLQRQILKLGVGKEVTLTVRRGTQDVPVKMTLEPMLTMPADAARWRSENLALIVRERLLVDQYTIDSATVPGVLVEGVYQRGPAETADVQPNDLITTINDQPVQTVGDVKKLVEASVAANPGKAVTLVVRRGAGGDTKSLAIQPVMPQSQPTSAPAR
jgi:S1-C subfamily serine protease